MITKRYFILSKSYPNKIKSYPKATQILSNFCPKIFDAKIIQIVSKDYPSLIQGYRG